MEHTDGGLGAFRNWLLADDMDGSLLEGAISATHVLHVRPFPQEIGRMRFSTMQPGG